MNKSQKLHEALAMVINAQREIGIRLGSVGLNKTVTKQITPEYKAAWAALEALEQKLYAEIVKETGNTTQRLWEIAAENCGRKGA